MDAVVTVSCATLLGSNFHLFQYSLIDKLADDRMNTKKPPEGSSGFS